jgi:hypothetical protein
MGRTRSTPPSKIDPFLIRYAIRYAADEVDALRP